MKLDLNHIMPINHVVRDFLLINYLYKMVDKDDKIRFGDSGIKFICRFSINNEFSAGKTKDVPMHCYFKCSQRYFINYKGNNILMFRVNSDSSSSEKSGISFFPEFDLGSDGFEFEKYEVNNHNSSKHILRLDTDSEDYLFKQDYEHQYYLYLECMNLLHHVVFKEFNLDDSYLLSPYQYARISEQIGGHGLAKEALSALNDLKIKYSDITIEKKVQ